MKPHATRPPFVSWLIGLLGLVCTCDAPKVVAQSRPPQAPVYSVSDRNDVDLLSGTLHTRMTDLSIGQGKSALVHSLWFDATPIPVAAGPAEYSPIVGAIPGFDSFYWRLFTMPQSATYMNGSYITTYLAGFGDAFELFYQSGSAYISLSQKGATLVANANGTWTYTDRDRVATTFGGLAPTKVTYPDARVLTITQKTVPGVTGGRRVQSVTRSDGLQLKYNYAANGTPTNSNVSTWLQLVGITAINNAVDYCDPAADTCALSVAWPTATYARSLPPSGTGSILTVTDPALRVTRYTFDSQGRITGIKWPSSASADNLSYTYCDNSCYVIDQSGGATFPNMIQNVVRDGSPWTYSFGPGGGYSFSYYGSTSPVGGRKTASLAATFAPQTTFVTAFFKLIDEDGTTYYADPTLFTGRITTVTKPEGGGASYGYDSRGNVTGVSVGPNTGFTDPAIQVSAGYDPTCAIPVKCNKPNWVRDALQNQTDYTYDPTHGGILTVTSPAVNGIRAQKRYFYAQRYAWVKNASGAYVQSANPIWVPTKESYCRTTAYTGTACTVPTDEVVTTYEYGPDAGPNNLFLRGFALTADGETLRTCYSYDAVGNKISETLPRAGLASCP